MVECPICSKQVQSVKINDHIDSQCQDFVIDPAAAAPVSSSPAGPGPAPSTQNTFFSSQKRPASSFFQTPAAKKQATPTAHGVAPRILLPVAHGNDASTKLNGGQKRRFDEGPGQGEDSPMPDVNGQSDAVVAEETGGRVIKRTKTSKAAPLAERMRPHNFNDVFGQELVGPHGVLRSLIETDRVPSMILWGGSGGKKIFTEAENDLKLTGRKTIIFCDEIHRFNKAQQDVFLKPVEAGTITLIGATTENPSFKVVNALLSRCRTFTLQKLTTEDVGNILQRALRMEQSSSSTPPSSLLDDELLAYLANFADGDARTALNLLELAISLSTRENITKSDIKASLTKTLVYDRAGDQHYDTISAFHKSVRGSDADAALYYLARMLQSGEDPLFIARRMVVIASEDVGLADNSLLTLATSTYTATQQIGMPEARIPLAHCAVALCQAPKSTRAYRGLNNAYAALREPGVAGLPVPIHLRNAPTRLMKDLGYGAEYKYNPNYKDGKVKQDYLPDDLLGRRFLEDRDLGTVVDPDLVEEG